MPSTNWGHVGTPWFFSESVVPLTRGGLQVKRRRWYLEMLGGAVGAEELLSLVQLGNGFVGAVELWKTELMGWRRRGTGRRRTVDVETALLL